MSRARASRFQQAHLFFDKSTSNIQVDFPSIVPADFLFAGMCAKADVAFAADLHGRHPTFLRASALFLVIRPSRQGTSSWYTLIECSAYLVSKDLNSFCVLPPWRLLARGTVIIAGWRRRRRPLQPATQDGYLNQRTSGTW